MMKKRESMVMTQFCIHPNLLQELREYAVEHDSSVSQVIRVAIARYLGKSLKTPVFQISYISRYHKTESFLNDIGAK